jgi:hypothetical protein
VPNQTAQGIAATSGPYAQVRTGTVVEATTNSATIVVGGTSFAAAFISPYVPAPGHLVAVIRQDATWLILGRIAGAGENLVTNGSFESGVNGGPADGWTHYEISGNTVSVIQASPLAVAGANVLSVITGSGGTASCYDYSNPIPVTAGDQFTLSAYVGAQQGPSSPAPVNAGLYALWFANATDLYPTTSAADTLAATFSDVPTAPPFTPLSGTVTAPVTGAMRVALRSTPNNDSSLLWDLIIAREVA